MRPHKEDSPFKGASRRSAPTTFTPTNKKEKKTKNMTELILKIYGYIKTHRKVGLLSCLFFTLLILLSVSRLSYEEDIADFLSIDNQHQNALKVYQDISGAGKMFAIFQYTDSSKTDPDVLTACADRFVAEVEKADTAHEVQNLMAEVDLEKMSAITDFVYNNIPYFLTDADYARMDSALNRPNFISEQLQADKQMLMFPTGSILSDNIQRDPLNLFTPTVQKLQRASSGLSYEMYNGHIFSPDMQRAIVMMDSPYGASETEHNSQLIDKLRLCAKRVTASTPEVEVHIIGGPVIAVGNASQIKQDSILSVSISVVLILALLFITFRNWRNLFLIVLSIGWGWLFAMGGLSLVHNRVSVIVVGISSVILGIAVNYPLHFIAHLSHTPNKRKALREIVMPLLVGNITTVGAFLTLVPLQSVALRDLGLFSSFLLMGTIIFVLIYLPHLSRVTKAARPTFLDRIGEVSLENKRWVVATVVMFTVVFGYFSLQTQFDANMGHINYMTDEQKADMAYFQKAMTPNGTLQKVYAISSDSTLDGALDKSLRLQPHLQQLHAQHQIADFASCNQFICSKKEQQRRLALWDDFLHRHGQQLSSELAVEGAKEGFSPESFADFAQIMGATYDIQPTNYFDPLLRQVFASNVSADSVAHQYNVVNILSVADAKVAPVEQQLNRHGCYSFDVVSMNSAIANHLSNDFNYIGFACGFIVFFFLWLSMGSIELATLSFVPMAVSWLWILGIMAIFGMQFNIVNVILATFIFGQGDDYTIFMTEGAMYEYAYRRKMLASYKHSIIISALIMFIGIGTLIVARHPALHSLAEVTIAGMFSVVLMAYIFPSLLFRMLVMHHGAYRRRPLSLIPVARMLWAMAVGFAQLITVYVAGFILLELLPATPRRRRWLHRYTQRLCHYALTHTPGVRFHAEGFSADTFSKPCIVVANHQSELDAIAFMSLSEKTIIVANGNSASRPIISKIYRWLEFVSLSGNLDKDLPLLRQRMADGYSLVVFPEGERNNQSSILRFQDEAFLLAEQLHADILPVLLHGFNEVLPQDSASIFRGTLTLSLRPRITADDNRWGATYQERANSMHDFFVKEYKALAHQQETAAYWKDFVLDRYRYKDTGIYRTVRHSLNATHCFTADVDVADDGHEKIIYNDSFGEMALVYACVHPHQQVIVVEADEERRALITHCAEFTDNLKCVEKL
jgi:uncharacterized protein